jgi:hypothetical protein
MEPKLFEELAANNDEIDVDALAALVDEMSPNGLSAVSFRSRA